MIKLSKLLEPLVNKRVTGFTEQEIKGLAYDSRKTGPGSLFACLPGSRGHGCDYIPLALERGAAAVLTDREGVDTGQAVKILVPRVREALAILSCRFYAYPSSRLRLIGVTGTNGKTTTTYLLRELLGGAGVKTGLIGTINYKIGDKDYPPLATTPEAPDLQEIFYNMVQAGVKYAFIEVSSHALELERAAGSDFDLGVLTNITEDHLDFHHTFDRYREAKASFFSGLGNNFFKGERPRVAVLNRDDPNYAYISQKVQVQKITYGTGPRAQVRAVGIEVRDRGVSFQVDSPWGREEFHLRMTGLFSVYNALAALSVALVEGLGMKESREALESIGGVPGRFEKVDLGQDFTVIVDYAHTPDGLKNLLETVNQFARGRILTVFGCGGDRDRTKRAPMGEMAGRYSDFCFLTSDNPRTEDPWQIFRDVEPGLLKTRDRNSYVIYSDRRMAISEAMKMAKPGDVLVIAGKGHEGYQVFKDHTIQFDDRRVAREILSGLLKQRQTCSSTRG